MRNKNVQISLFDTYNDVCSAMENNKSEFLRMLETHINLKEWTPSQFAQFIRRSQGF